jgi:chemotaxis protein MotB
MLSYADMLTLLLALFIVMFAISQVDQKKFEQFSRGTAEYFGSATMSLNGTDGILDGQPPGPTASPSASAKADQAGAADALAREKARAAAAKLEHEQMSKVRDKIRRELAAKGLKDAVEFQLDERGLVVNIVTDKVLFDTGKADLRVDGITVLGIITPSVLTLPNRVTVEGHTDNVPMSGVFASNWELSTARATTVVRQLIRGGLPATRVSAAGYADQRPLGSNASLAGRARNRRVAIVVLPRLINPALTTASSVNNTAASVPVAATHSGA